MSFCETSYTPKNLNKIRVRISKFIHLLNYFNNLSVDYKPHVLINDNGNFAVKLGFMSRESIDLA